MDEIKVLVVSTFYLSLNTVPLVFTCTIFFTWYYAVSPWTIVLCISPFLLDFIVPLKSANRNETVCRLADDTEGKITYFPLEMRNEFEPKRNKNYMIGYHPHALYGIGMFSINKELNVKFGTTTLFTGANIVQQIPFLRRFMTCLGFTPASAEAMKKNLQLPYPRNVLMHTPGGIAEMFYGLEEEQIVLEKRKGFCKIALQTGAHLVPSYIHGANHAYSRGWGPDSFMFKLSSKLRVSIVCFTGLFDIPFNPCPKRKRLIVCIGKPIEVEKVEKPTNEQVVALHSQYVKELKALFDRYKGDMGEEYKHKQLYLETDDISHLKGNKNAAEAKKTE